jgi:hypothetical protein
MKKYLFFALAIAGMLSSCSNDDIVSDGGKGKFDSSELIPIKIGMGHSTTTRGTGTVGGFDNASDNKWVKQTVNVFMLHKDSMALAIFDSQDQGFNEVIYNNAPFYTPDGAQTGIATPLSDSIKYYPTQGRYDFWGYRLDDAEVETPVFTDDSLSINFKINGSQDVMVAKAVPTQADTTKLHAGGNDEADRAFSAFAARWGVQPNLDFRHLLTRLTFDVIPGGESTIDPVTPVIVDSIRVISPNQGTLTIAKVGDVRGEKQCIWWAKDAQEKLLTDTLSLMQRDTASVTTAANNLIKLIPDSLKGCGHMDNTDPQNPVFVPDTVRIGEALLVAPDVTSYKMILYLRQPSQMTLNSQDNTDIPYVYKDYIKLSDSSAFQKGYSYKVQIKLWGLTDIKISTTLGKWEEGETIVLKPEDVEDVE